MDLYALLKTLHLLALISWMAALFYLPRLFVYHAKATMGSEHSETLKIMERRLYKGIMTPAMIATWVFGLSLAYHTGAYTQGWFHAKLVFVLALSAFHGLCGGWLKRFGRDENHHTENFYRLVNEVPTVLLVFIVILVVYKPF